MVFLNKYNSSVRQKSCGDNSKNENESSLLYEITRIDRTSVKKHTENESNEKNLSFFEKNYQKYYNSLKKLKEKDKSEFDSVLNKLKGVKGKLPIGKFLNLKAI